MESPFFYEKFLLTSAKQETLGEFNLANRLCCSKFELVGCPVLITSFLFLAFSKGLIPLL